MIRGTTFGLLMPPVIVVDQSRTDRFCDVSVAGGELCEPGLRNLTPLPDPSGREAVLLSDRS